MGPDSACPSIIGWDGAGVAPRVNPMGSGGRIGWRNDASDQVSPLKSADPRGSFSNHAESGSGTTFINTGAAPTEDGMGTGIASLSVVGADAATVLGVVATAAESNTGEGEAPGGAAKPGTVAPGGGVIADRAG